MASHLFDLMGRKAIVAGGAGGLGTGMVAALRDAGVDVVILDRASDLQQIVDELNTGGPGRVAGIQVDLTDRAALRASFEKAVEVLGTVDILVNSQGIQRRYPCEDFPIEEWDAVVEVNLTSAFLLCQLAGRIMLEKGYGKIINIASLNSFIGGITIPAYAASKGGLALLTKSLSNDWAGRGVTVNAIAPGYMYTKMTASLYEDPVRNAQIMARIPAKRLGRAEDMAGPLLFLASHASDYVTGSVICVDGGWMGI